MIEKIIKITEVAGIVIMSFYRGDQIGISLKKDK